MFQSTHPFGCDCERTRGHGTAECFNPRTRLGATLSRLNRPFRLSFQSTHPFGCDSIKSGNSGSCMRFNPRTRLGATRGVYPVYPGEHVSIHAPVWVRLWRFHLLRPHRCFNPRTRLGATWGVYLLATDDAVSIHAPVWVRRTGPLKGRWWQMFQSTHPFGCDSENFIFSLLSFTSMYLSSHYRVLFGSD